MNRGTSRHIGDHVTAREDDRDRISLPPLRVLADQAFSRAAAYFAGMTSYVQALCAAALDGVDVRLLLSGASDIPLPSPLSRSEPMDFVHGADAPAAKFQFSFRFQVAAEDGWLARKAPFLRGFMFGYTQRSLWDLEGDSSPRTGGRAELRPPRARFHGARQVVAETGRRGNRQDPTNFRMRALAPGTSSDRGSSRRPWHDVRNVVIPLCRK